MKYARKPKKTNLLPLVLEIVLILAIVAGCVLLFIKYMSGETDTTEPPMSDQPGQTSGQEVTAPPETTVPPTTVDTSPEGIIRAFAADNGLSFWDYPVKVVEMLERNPETVDFVLSYPLKYNTVEENIDMSEYEDDEGVPLFMQWDTRWGYMEYGNDAIGFTGCGPTNLAMVAYFYTKDPEMRPDKIAQFAIDNGFCAPGNGSYWSLISKGGAKLGLKVTEIPLDKDRMIRNLEAGYPIICIMGPGAFTTGGHFITLVDYVDGKFQVNDCNSYKNSAKLWEYEEFYDQINNLWVIRPGE